MKMQGWVIGVTALLAAGAAQAADSVYAKVGSWEISADTPSRCVMQRFYRSKDGKKIEGLTVLYAADKEGVLLLWTNDWMTYLPVKGNLELGLAFRKGEAADQSWGSRNLPYERIGDTYYFTIAFKSAEETGRILRDLAASDHFGLLLGPALLTSMPLDASEAVVKLRECSMSGGRAQ
jgi:hypothetical protein